MSKILLVCDPPVDRSNSKNVGGVHAVTGSLATALEKSGHGVEILTQEHFQKTPCDPASRYMSVGKALNSLPVEKIHIVTQAWLGLLVRRYCLENGLAFTTAYHTQIPEYLQVRHGVPARVTYSYMRWFLNAAEQVIVPTPTMARNLAARGVKNVVPCMHGVDTERFAPGDPSYLSHLQRPIFLNVGRVTPEKNPEAFLALDLPGTKVMVGDGPLLRPLQEKYPEVHFAGVRTGSDLVRYYAAADVFVFPSRTDTFGLVLLEALATGTPVAAYPVTGPLDVISDPRIGCIDKDLRRAALGALELSRNACREFALRNTWGIAAQRFLNFQVPTSAAGKHPRSLLYFAPRHDRLERLVAHTEKLLFGDEPEGPYSKMAKKQVA